MHDAVPPFQWCDNPQPLKREDQMMMFVFAMNYATNLVSPADYVSAVSQYLNGLDWSKTAEFLRPSSFRDGCNSEYLQDSREATRNVVWQMPAG